MPENTINPDVICQRALQAQLEVYRAKEHFEAILKTYNEHMGYLANTIGLMKSRIMELEEELKKKDHGKSNHE